MGENAKSRDHPLSQSPTLLTDEEKKREESVQQHLFLDLCRRCQLATAASRLPPLLLHSLLNLPSARDKRDLVGTLYQGAPPLVHAARSGNPWLVDLLISELNADLEARGVHHCGEPPTVHRGTALWVASVCGHLEVVRILCERGAQLEARTETGTTPLIAACYWSRLDVVEYLLSRGANVHALNHNGGTCLINGVQSPAITRMLLSKGALVSSQDNCGRTALHYAVEGGYPETVSILLDAGADPWQPDAKGDDALRVACLTGHVDIADKLLRRTRVTSPEESTSDTCTDSVSPPCLPSLSQEDAYRLMGCSILSWDLEQCRELWLQAGDTEQERTTEDLLIVTRRDLYPGGEAQNRRTIFQVKEWKRTHELSGMDSDTFHCQSLLIYHRLLGPNHQCTWLKMWEYGLGWLRSGAYEEGFTLLQEVVFRKVDILGILSRETGRAFSCVVQFYIASISATAPPMLNGSHSRVIVPIICSLLLRLLSSPALPLGIHLASRPPQCRRQRMALEDLMKGVLQLIHVMLNSVSPPSPLIPHVRSLVTTDPRGLLGESLLHMAVSPQHVFHKLTALDHQERVALREFSGGAAQVEMFPSFSVASLLLSCGSDPNAYTKWGSTPLHVASEPRNFEQDVVDVLLSHGAHLDVADMRHGSSASPLVRLTSNPQCVIYPLRYTSLKCLSARAIREKWTRKQQEALHDPTLVPRELCAFVQRH